jgi:hypothetical protein
MTSLTLPAILSLLLCGASARPEQPLSQIVGGTLIQHSTSSFVPFNQGVTYRTYQNARYNFSIAYPSTLKPEGESDNGDGQTFRSRDDSVLMRAWGSQNISNESLRAAYQSAISDIESIDGGNATYKFLGRNFFVVSGLRGGKVIYQKTLMRGDVFKTFLIEYPVAMQSTYDPITARVARSFKG